MTTTTARLARPLTTTCSTSAADYFGPTASPTRYCDNGQSGSPLADDFKCSTAVATITVTPVNDAPVATADAKTTAEDTAANVLVLANDTTGPANESDQTLNIDSITVAATARHGRD